MKAKYSHSWLVPIPLNESWNFLLLCLRDSSQAAEWPHFLSHLNFLGEDFKIDQTLEAQYKFGPASSKVYYKISQFITFKKIVYETTRVHPLQGSSEIVLTEEKGKTRWRWTGYYEQKSLSSLVSLAWFKLVFEKIFFLYFIKVTQKIKPGKYRVPQHDLRKAG